MSDWLGWHFVAEDRCLANGDGRPVRVGETYSVDGEPVLCEHGLHASKRALDALRYAPGAIACRARLSGTIVEGEDKACATERTVLAMADATRTLHEFAIWCAEGALKRANVKDGRCWEALAVKRRWLDGQASDEELTAARPAARDAVWAAARDAGTAAGSAALTAVWAAARDARDAAWEAAWAAARHAARDARDAAWDAAWDAVWDAWDAAWDASRDAQNAELERRLLALVEAHDA
jgi:hypothetical protein